MEHPTLCVGCFFVLILGFQLTKETRNGCHLVSWKWFGDLIFYKICELWADSAHAVFVDMRVYFHNHTRVFDTGCFYVISGYNWKERAPPRIGDLRRVSYER